MSFRRIHSNSCRKTYLSTSAVSICKTALSSRESATCSSRESLNTSTRKLTPTPKNTKSFTASSPNIWRRVSVPITYTRRTLPTCSVLRAPCYLLERWPLSPSTCKECLRSRPRSTTWSFLTELMLVWANSFQFLTNFRTIPLLRELQGEGNRSFVLLRYQIGRLRSFELVRIQGQEAEDHRVQLCCHRLRERLLQEG